LPTRAPRIVLRVRNGFVPASRRQRLQRASRILPLLQFCEEKITALQVYHSLELTMMEKTPQRTRDDCTICALAMVMGPPYTYERVLDDSRKYTKTDDKGRTLPWWKEYLEDEDFASN